MNVTLKTLSSLALATLIATGCAQGPSVAELNVLTDQVVKSSFRDESYVKVERITATDETNRLCSAADVAGKPLDEATAKLLPKPDISEQDLSAIPASLREVLSPRLLHIAKGEGLDKVENAIGALADAIAAGTSRLT